MSIKDSRPNQNGIYDWKVLSEENGLKIQECFDNSLKHFAKFKIFDEVFIFIKTEGVYNLIFNYPDNFVEIRFPRIQVAETIINKCLHEGIMYSIRSEERFDDFTFIGYPQKAKSLLIVPVMVNGLILCVSIFTKNQQRYFDKIDLSIFEFFAYQTGIILKNTIASNQIQRKSQQLAEINNICHHIDSIMTNEELYRRVVDVIQKSFDYDHVALYLVDLKCNKIVLKSLAGIYEGLVPQDQTLEFNQGIVGHVIQSGQTILSNNTKKNPHFFNLTPNQTPTQSELCVPIKISNKIIGALNIESRNVMNFDADDLNSLEVLANRVGVAVQNSNLYNEIKENNQRLYDIVSSMGEGISVLDKDFKIIWSNKTFEKWVGKRHNFINKHCYEIFGKSSSFCSECPARITFKTGKIIRRMMRSRAGKYYNITSAPIKGEDGSINKILEVYDDITENIKIRKKLDKLRNKLEHNKCLTAVGELTANIAHEIKNPLNALSCAIDILQNDLKVSGDHAKLMNIAREESRRLEKIISHYLNFTSIPELSFIKNNIQRTIDETIQLLKLDNSIAGRIKFNTYFEDNLPELIFDCDSIKQVFWNLLMNSVEAVSSEGVVQIGIEKFDTIVKITIEDNGKGIPKSKLNNIFKQFYSTKARGTGLGLSIVKKILDRHHWAIDLESEPGLGTKFTIIVPLELSKPYHEQNTYCR